MDDKYDILEKIGDGSYGRVFKAKDKATGDNVAVKFIDTGKFEHKERKNIRKEYNTHAKLQHPNIIKMLDSFEIVECIVIVTELAEIDLHGFMKKVKLSECHVKKLTCHLLSALHYLHTERILHRDLKPQNVLLNNYKNVEIMQAKLCDFGLARKMTTETFLLTSIKGTPLYMAPEVMDDALYDERADLWSVGCILYETAFGKPPIKTQSFTELIRWLRNPKIKWPIKANACTSFLKGLLEKEAKARLTWPEIIAHPYLDNNLLILYNTESNRPLTEALTSSQQIKKEKQRREIILHRDKKMIAEAMNKCQMLKQSPDEEDEKPTKNKRHNVIGDNDSISSTDSVNAIVQTDLETDVEGPPVERRNSSIRANVGHLPSSDNQQFVIKRYADNFSVEQNATVVENNNLRLGRMMENLQIEVKHTSNMPATKQIQINPAVKIEKHSMALERPSSSGKSETLKSSQSSGKEQTGISKELEKRKLGHNLENFSIRMGNNEKVIEKHDDETTKETHDSAREVNVEKTPGDLSETATESDVFGESHNPPFLNEEWLAFLNRTAREILNKEMDTLRDSNMVNMIVGILRNSAANIKVIERVVQLLSIPLVLGLSNAEILELKAIYVQTKLLPNLLFACKIICTVKNISSISSSNNLMASYAPDQNSLSELHELSSEQMKTLRTTFELVCHLMHLGECTFLSQFCDSAYLFTGDLLRHFYSNAAVLLLSEEGTKLLSVVTAILCFVLRESPENAGIIEEIIFDPNVNVIALLKNEDAMLRVRLCWLIRIIGRFSTSALQEVWNSDFRTTLEVLLDEDNQKVKEAAKSTLDELRGLPFYKMNRSFGIYNKF